MTTPDALAEKALPCFPEPLCNPRHPWHASNCPYKHRPAVAAAIREAVEGEREACVVAAEALAKKIVNDLEAGCNRGVVLAYARNDYISIRTPGGTAP